MSKGKSENGAIKMLGHFAVGAIGWSRVNFGNKRGAKYG